MSVIFLHGKGVLLLLLFFLLFLFSQRYTIQIIGTIKQTQNVFNGCFPKCFSNASSLGNSLLHISHCGLNQNNIFKEFLEVHYRKLQDLQKVKYLI